MKKFFLFFLLASTALAQTTKPIVNRSVDGNVVIRVNDGGVPTNVISVNGGTGAVTIGAPAANVDHPINGRLSVLRGVTSPGGTSTTFKLEGVSGGVGAFRAPTSGAAVNTDLFSVTMVNGGGGGDYFIAYFTILQTRSTTEASSVYEGYAIAHGDVTATFPAPTVDLKKTIKGTNVAPTITWEGAGATRTLRVTNNATFGTSNISYQWSFRNSSGLSSVTQLTSGGGM